MEIMKIESSKIIFKVIKVFIMSINSNTIICFEIYIRYYYFIYYFTYYLILTIIKYLFYLYSSYIYISFYIIIKCLLYFILALYWFVIFCQWIFIYFLYNFKPPLLVCWLFEKFSKVKMFNVWCFVFEN